MFFSTRNSSLRVSASQAIIQGLAPDGGLFFPVQIGKVEMKEDLLNKSYQELAFLILRLYLDDFSDEEIKITKNEFDKRVANKKNTLGLRLIPLYLYPSLPIGITLTSIDGEEIVFDGSNIDTDIRFGCLAWGIKPKKD